MKKKLISYLLTLAMVLSMIPMQVFAEDLPQVVIVDKTEVKVGEEVHVQVILPEGLEPVSSITAKLKFNNEAFEVIERTPADPISIGRVTVYPTENMLLDDLTGAVIADYSNQDGMLNFAAAYQTDSMSVVGYKVIDAVLKAKQAGDLDLEFEIFAIRKAGGVKVLELDQIAAPPVVTAVEDAPVPPAPAAYQVVTTDKTEVKVGEEVHVQVILPEGLDLVSSITAKLKFDNECFEVVERTPADPISIGRVTVYPTENMLLDDMTGAVIEDYSNQDGMLNFAAAYQTDSMDIANYKVIDAVLKAKRAGELDLEFEIFAIRRAGGVKVLELDQIAAPPVVTATAAEAATFYVEGTILGVDEADIVTVQLIKDGDVILGIKVNGGDKFRFEGLEPYNYGLNFVCAGYEDHYTTFYIEDQDVAGFDIELTKLPTTYYIKGTVNGPAETETVTVRLLDAKQSKIDEMTVNGGGTYKFYDLLPGTYYIDASCAGYNDYFKAVNVTNDNYYLDFVMEKKEVVDYLSMLQAEGSDVTINGGLNTEVTVTLEATGDMDLYGIAGYWDVEELDGEGFLTLKEIDSDVLRFTGGTNYIDEATGHVMWSDETFENPAVLSNGTKLLIATYTVNGDMPAGTYTVRFRSETLTGSDFEPNETVTYYKAQINVTRVGDPLPTATVGGSVSGVEGNELVTVRLYKAGEAEDDATATIYGNGTFTFAKVQPGAYVIKATANGYEEYISETLNVTLDGLTHNIAMVKKEVKPPVADGYLGMLTAEDEKVTIYSGEDTEVTVALVGTDDMMVYGIAGNWDLKEQGSKYLTLSGMSSEVLTFSGMNYVDVPTGHVEWTDDSFEAPTVLSNGTKLLTATYAVDGDTPEGEYIVRFYASTLTADDFEPNETGAYYTATITVKHHTHVPGTPVEEKRVEAQCEVDGSYEEVVYCADATCGMELSRTDKVIPMLGHDYHVVCTRCEEVDPAAVLNVQDVAGDTYTYEVTYGVNSRIITVTNDIATKVGYLNAGGTYTAITAEATADADTYTFAVPSTDADVGVVTNILIVVKGDISADGAFQQGDKTLMARSLLAESKPAYKALTLIEQFAADINGDEKAQQGDKTLMARALLAESKPAYKALGWAE